MTKCGFWPLGVLIDNQLTGKWCGIGRFFALYWQKGRLEWQKPGTNESGRGRNDRKRRRSWKKSRTEKMTKAIRTGPTCWLMLMKTGIFLQNQLMVVDRSKSL